MSARKSLPRRLSRYSIQSQISGVLDPDSNVYSEDEGQPLWFKDFESNSINIRPSAGLSLVQNETPLLDSNSEPETTPLEKSWWKNLDNTPEVRPGRSNIPREKSIVPESSNLESTDASLLEEGVAKKRLALRRIKRKILQRNVFSEILNRSKNSISSEKIGRKTQNEEKRDEIISPSDTDISIEKVRRPTFKKKKRTKLVRKSSNVASKSDESLPNVFKDVLASQSVDESRHEATATNVPGSPPGNQEASSPNSVETIRLELDRSPSENLGIASAEVEDDQLGDEDLERSKSPVMISRPKKRTIFTKTTKRRAPNFDDLLNDESEDELPADEPSIRGETELNQSQRRGESIAQFTPELDLRNNNPVEEDESEMDENIKKQRVPFGRKKRQSHQDKIFAQLPESLNTSARSEPVSARKQTGDLESPRHRIPWSDVDRQTSKRRRTLADTSGSLNVEVEGNESARKLSHLSNKSDAQRRSTNKLNVRTETSGPSDVELEEDRSASMEIDPSGIGDNSGIESQSIDKKNRETSRLSNIGLEGDQLASKLNRRSSRADTSNVERQSTNKTNDRAETSDRSVSTPIQLSSVGNKSGTERHSTNKKNDRGESSGPLTVELRENLGRAYAAERRSTNKENDHAETSSSSNAEEEENQSVSIPSRRSIGLDKPRDSDQNKNSLYQRQVNRERLSARAKNTSQRGNNKSMGKGLSASTDEEDDEEEISRNVEDLPSNSDIIDQAQKNREYSNDSRLQPRDVNSANNMEKTVPFDLAQKDADKRKTVSNKKSRSMVAQNLEYTCEVLQENNWVSRMESNRTHAADGIENTEIGETWFTGIETMAQSVMHGTERSFTFIDPNGTESVQQANASSIVGSQATNAEKMSQIKSALEKVKTKELASLKNTKIDSYFKKTSATRPANDVAAKDLQKLPNKTRPVGNKSKTASVSPNKAYLVNGKAYKRPKLPRPKLWATARLYNFLWKKLQSKYQLRTRIRSEKFVTDLSKVVALVTRRHKYDNYKEDLNNLIREMARLEIIRTRNDFNIFCQDFLPYDFRIKVIPMILPGNVRNMPFNPDKLHTPIFKS